MNVYKVNEEGSESEEYTITLHICAYDGDKFLVSACSLQDALEQIAARCLGLGLTGYIDTFEDARENYPQTAIYATGTCSHCDGCEFRDRIACKECKETSPCVGYIDGECDSDSCPDKVPDGDYYTLTDSGYLFTAEVDVVSGRY